MSGASPTGSGWPIEPSIRQLGSDEVATATALLAEGMRDNPLHMRVLGSDAQCRQQRLQRLLGHLVSHVVAHGILRGAFVDGQLCGVLGAIAPSHCRPGLSLTLRLAGVIAREFPPTVGWRVANWLVAWRSHDPREPHWHLGPMAVPEAMRRRGIARQLMRACCAHIDACGHAAYLETDLERNARFYASLGFLTLRQTAVLGVPNWFMYRPATIAIPATEQQHDATVFGEPS